MKKIKIIIKYEDSISNNGDGIKSVTIDDELFEPGLFELLETLQETIEQLRSHEISIYIGNATAFSYNIFFDWDSDIVDAIIDEVYKDMDKRFDIEFIKIDK